MSSDRRLQPRHTHLMDWNLVDSQAHQTETDRHTLVVRYAIATNTALQHTQVPEAVRQFLMEVWVEVLAEAQLRNDPLGPTLQALRQTAQALLDIACLRRKHDRKLCYGARLPTLLPRLLDGMTLVRLDAREKAHQLQALQIGMGERMAPSTNANPTDAWSAAVLLMSRREPLVDGLDLHSHRQLNDLALQVMTHHDQFRLHTVTHGGNDPCTAILQRVDRLQVGDRFWRKRTPLSRTPVQLEWLGRDGQLCLLCDNDHTGYLYHRARLARHLQAGIVVPDDTPVPRRT